VTARLPGFFYIGSEEDEEPPEGAPSDSEE